MLTYYTEATYRIPMDGGEDEVNDFPLPSSLFRLASSSHDYRLSGIVTLL
jgi:hypothetical protein